jgi:hypothetical protein
VTDVDSLIRELGAVQDRLIALPDDAFAERFELLKRQDELRHRAAAHTAGVDNERPTEDLLAELASLRQRRNELESQHINVMLQASNVDAAGFSGHADAAQLNRRMGFAQGLPQLVSRIGRIKGILTDRGVGVD